MVVVIVDFDDFCETSHRLDLLELLHDANSDFRCTLFAIPALGSEGFWASVPEWCELAVHGWTHPHPMEAANWSREETIEALDRKPEFFVDGFKAPGWQVSDATYEVLTERGWWIADHYDNDARRPKGQLSHVISTTASNGDDPLHWHGHIPNVCGNGIEETFTKLVLAVTFAESFELISESVSPW